MNFIAFSVKSQTTVKGKIIDKQTRQPIPAVTITLPEIKAKTFSSGDGNFKIFTNKQVSMITFSAIGYKTFNYFLPKKGDYQLTIELDETFNTLNNVNITAARKTKRYSNKNNPAVELIRNVIANRDKNRKQQNNDVVYKQYEKLNLSLSMKRDQLRSSSIIRKFPFLLRTADSLKRQGKALIPLFMRERLSLCLETKNSENDRNQVLGEKQSRIDQYFDEEGIDEYLTQIYQHVDIYDNDIGIGSQRFLSPIASLAPELYKYFIADTLKDVKPNVVRLMFSPRNKQDQLFMGEMRIPLNGDYAVADVTLTLNEDVNLNFVNDFEVNIIYKKDEEGKYYIAKSVTDMGLGLFKDKYNLFGSRTLLTTDYRFTPKNFVFPTQNPVLSKNKVDKTFERPEGLTSLEQNAYNNIDSLKKSPKFKRMAAISALVLTGYQKAGPIDIGPVGSFYSFNQIEGTRIRLSARTNIDFSDKVVLEGHVARGMKDKKWKYAISAAYSFKPEGPLHFPIHSFTVKHSYETQIPGQDLNFIEDDNFLLSFKRGVNDKWLYNRKWSGEYFRELESHISFRLGYRNQELDPTGGLVFQPVSALDPVDRLNLSEFTSELRWAPNEQFYQGKRFRRPIKNGYPIFTLRASAGVKGFLKGDYNYQNVSLHIFKRLFVAPFGYSDITMEGGMVFGKVPFPLLAIHRANQTYSYQNQSYNLMNFMEFMSDRYASINIDHSLNGVILNKIPLIKRLQLREMASLKVLYGGITYKNKPENNTDLYRFATNNDGAQTSFALGNAPYMEGSLGIGNIFKLLRVDYVMRFSYLNQPNVTRSGIRAKIHVDF
ncbi:DUF5686 family protein [Pedobacter sp. ASV1-7]|uniref:DUF5686 family protein n=1 Tax=Pedobacter sp. ASV1-7 TaxID=3145237 RepID=UPI0032E89234